MTDAKLYGRGELAAIAGAPEDAVIFWISQGLLRSVDLGTRKHRRFDSREVKIAALLRWARSIGLNVRAMGAVVAYVRDSYACLDALPPAPHIHDIVTEASWRRQDRADGRPFDGFASQQRNYGLTDDQVAAMVAVYEVLPDDPEYADKVLAAADFELGEGMIAVFVDEDEQWRADRRVSDSGSLPGPALVAFDLGKVLALEWPAE